MKEIRQSKQNWVRTKGAWATIPTAGDFTSDRVVNHIDYRDTHVSRPQTRSNQTSDRFLYLLNLAQLERTRRKYEFQMQQNLDSFATQAERIFLLSQLPINWDGYGAEQIRATAIARATQVLFELVPVRPEYFSSPLSPHFIAPLVDGGLQLEWYFGSAELEVMIDGKGNMEYLLLTNVEQTGEQFLEGSLDDIQQLSQMIVERANLQNIGE